MGEKKPVKKATADGYEFNDVTSNDGIITVGKVWELAESDLLFAHYDKNQRLKRLCHSFAFFKLLRRRFEHLPAMTDAEARDCRSLYSNNNGEGDAAEALFQVMSDEVNFLGEYYHSTTPSSRSSSRAPSSTWPTTSSCPSSWPSCASRPLSSAATATPATRSEASAETTTR
jgi:hypothetical protein